MFKQGENIMYNLLRVFVLALMTFAISQNSHSFFDTKKEIKSKNSTEHLLESEKRRIKIYEESVSSVVNVSNLQTVRSGSFFGMPEQREMGAGTGFVWDDQGHIVTNFHVVRDEKSKFMISFYNQKDPVEAKIVGVEPKLDIAVLKVKKLPKGVKPIKVGSSHDLKVGQGTIAIGNPFELDYSMTSGIVSALGRKIDGIGGVKIHNMIQTDASINPGNSGGPLLNMNGLLIGMNTLIFSPSRASAGLGFSVPVDSINRVVPDLIKHGKVIRPGLGISPLPESYRQYLGSRIFGKKGVIVASVEPSSAADIAGIKGMRRDRRGRIYLGDTILEIEGKEVNSLDDIFQLLQNYKIADTIKVKIQNDEGQKKTLKVKLKAL